MAGSAWKTGHAFYQNTDPGDIRWYRAPTAPKEPESFLNPSLKAAPSTFGGVPHLGLATAEVRRSQTEPGREGQEPFDRRLPLRRHWRHAALPAQKRVEGRTDTWVWLKNSPKWNPGKWQGRLKPASCPQLFLFTPARRRAPPAEFGDRPSCPLG